MQTRTRSIEQEFTTRKEEKTAALGCSKKTQRGLSREDMDALLGGVDGKTHTIDRGRACPWNEIGDGRPRVPKATQGERTGVTRPEDRLARDGRGQLPRGVPRKRGERLRPDTVDQAQA